LDFSTNLWSVIDLSGDTFEPPTSPFVGTFSIGYDVENACTVIQSAMTDDENDEFSPPHCAMFKLELSRSLPAWRVGQSVGSFVTLTGTAMSNFPPSTVADTGLNAVGGPHMKIDAWCGFGFDRRDNSFTGLRNGGHGDYYGYETNRIRFSADNPAVLGWVELQASGPSTNLAPLSSFNTDGRPGSSHTYNTTHVVTARNKCMSFCSMAVNSGAVNTGDILGFDLTSHVWDSAATYPSFSGAIAAGYPVCQNPDTEDAYLFQANYTVQKWDQASNTISEVQTGFPPVAFSGCSAEYDTSRDRIFLLRGPGGICHTFDTDDGTFTSRTITGPAASAVMALGYYIGKVYDRVTDAYYIRGGAAGGTVYKVTADDTFYATVLTTTGGDSIPATSHDSGEERVCRRWILMPDYGGIMYIPTYTSDAVFLRIY